MIVYRVANAKYKEDTLSGIGAEKVGGRWNKPGTRAVYCSENISLALLEYYVHSENPRNLPKDILVAKILLQETFKIQELEYLPETWAQYPYTNETTDIYSELIQNRAFFVLKVPSTIVRLEYNYILNPLFKEFGKVEILEFIQMPVDERVRKSY
jgi:RES domain-containing protein